MLLPITLEEVRCIAENMLCELYVVKVWKGLVSNSFSCHTIPRAWHGPWLSCFFSCCTLPSILYVQRFFHKM